MSTRYSDERLLTQIDYVRLTRLLSLSRPGPSAPIHALLENSDLVASTAVPATVVTMYTQVLVDDASGGMPHKVTLCYPDDAQPAQGSISVLSPLGASLLGLRVGDVARWRTPRGDERVARIRDVLFQPEASGDYTT